MNIGDTGQDPVHRFPDIGIKMIRINKIKIIIAGSKVSDRFANIQKPGSKILPPMTGYQDKIFIFGQCSNMAFLNLCDNNTVEFVFSI